jgi:hypothetical protein
MEMLQPCLQIPDSPPDPQNDGSPTGNEDNDGHDIEP